MNWFEAFEEKYQWLRPVISDHKARDQLDEAYDIVRKGRRKGKAPDTIPQLAVTKIQPAEVAKVFGLRVVENSTWWDLQNSERRAVPEYLSESFFCQQPRAPA
jgi:hypothetical protein